VLEQGAERGLRRASRLYVQCSESSGACGDALHVCICVCVCARCSKLSGVCCGSLPDFLLQHVVVQHLPKSGRHASLCHSCQAAPSPTPALHPTSTYCCFPAAPCIRLPRGPSPFTTPLSPGQDVQGKGAHCSDQDPQDPEPIPQIRERTKPHMNTTI